MHIGSQYPYLREFWQAECYFWPGWVPRKLYVAVDSLTTDSWSLLHTPIVTDVGTPDAFSIGDPVWTYDDPGGAFRLEVLLHKVSTYPNIAYSTPTRLILPSGHVGLASGQVNGPQRIFGPLPYDQASFDPPFFSGAVPGLLVRAAVWSEV